MLAVNDFIHSTWLPVTAWATAISVVVIAVRSFFGRPS